MAFSLPRLPTGTYSPAQFQIWWQQVVEAIEAEVGALEAADAANAAATAALAAAATANAAAITAQTTATNITTADSLAKSYVSGAAISAADAGSDVTVTISAHTRLYPQPDGSTVDVAVDGGTLTGLAYSTGYYIYYDDPSRAGGAVSYEATTDAATAAQIGDRHCVGGVMTPAALGADTGGDYTAPPGPGAIKGLTV